MKARTYEYLLVGVQGERRFNASDWQLALWEYFRSVENCRISRLGILRSDFDDQYRHNLIRAWPDETEKIIYTRCTVGRKNFPPRSRHPLRCMLHIGTNPLWS